jgi:hypothetical protein
MHFRANSIRTAWSVFKNGSGGPRGRPGEPTWSNARGSDNNETHSRNTDEGDAPLNTDGHGVRPYATAVALLGLTLPVRSR